MEGLEFARYIETQLITLGIKKGDFYNETGISATALYNWKRGATPSTDSIVTVNNYFRSKQANDIRATELAKAYAEKVQPQIDPGTAELLESLRKRPELGVLLRSAKDVPPSSIYEIVSKLEKMKEDGLGISD